MYYRRELYNVSSSFTRRRRLDCNQKWRVIHRAALSRTLTTGHPIKPRTSPSKRRRCLHSKPKEDHSARKGLAPPQTSFVSCIRERQAWRHECAGICVCICTRLYTYVWNGDSRAYSSVHERARAARLHAHTYIHSRVRCTYIYVRASIIKGARDAGTSTRGCNG